MLVWFVHARQHSAELARVLTLPRWKDDGITFDRPIVTARAIEWTLDTQRTSLKDVCVHHRRAQILMPQQLLDGADIVPRFQQVRGERMPERMAAHRF